MQRFKNLLLYAPPDVDVEPALRYAVRLAASNQGMITLVDCVEPAPAIINRLLPASWNLETVVCHDRQSRLDQMAGELRGQGIAVVTKVLLGRPAMEITREVLRSGQDLVMKTAQGTVNHKEEAFFGTTAIRLMRICPCQICVVDPAEDERFDRILTVIDPQTDEPEQCKLNEKVLELAVTLAEREGGQLDVLAAWTGFAESILHVKMSDEEVRTYIDAAQSAAQQYLGKLLDRFGRRIDPQRVHLLHGEPERVILDFTQQRKIDMLVIGTVGRHGLSGILMGNTAETVVHKVRCSILAVKPDTFVSPVKLDDLEQPSRYEPQSAANS
jgi:nucleotide-binding universal stress UspA family protein